MVTIANFDQDRYAATSAVRCIQVFIPDDDSYMPLLAGLLSLPGYVANYQDPESSQAEGVATVWLDAYVLTDWSACVTPEQATAQSRVTFWHRWAQISAGNALQIVVDPAQIFNHYVRQNTPALSNETYQDAYLNSGHYQMRVLYQRATGGGKVTWLFQNQDSLTQVTAINQQDLSGATQANSVLTASFDLTESGLWRMYTIVQAAGATGAGFFAPIICTEVWKTGEL